MTYTGEVRVASSDARDIDGLTIAKLAVGPMSNNAYLLRCPETQEGLLIDAADEPERLHSWSRLDGPPVSADSHDPPARRPLAGAGRRWSRDADAAVYAGAEDADELPVAVDERRRAR